MKRRAFMTGAAALLASPAIPASLAPQPPLAANVIGRMGQPVVTAAGIWEAKTSDQVYADMYHMLDAIWKQECRA